MLPSTAGHGDGMPVHVHGGGGGGGGYGGMDRLSDHHHQQQQQQQQQQNQMGGARFGVAAGWFDKAGSGGSGGHHGWGGFGGGGPAATALSSRASYEHRRWLLLSQRSGPAARCAAVVEWRLVRRPPARSLARSLARCATRLQLSFWRRVVRPLAARCSLLAAGPYLSTCYSWCFFSVFYLLEN
jgi:hypothetical protein